MVAEKNILILVEEKKKSDSEFLPYNLMLNSVKKINILTLVLSEKKFLNETKNLTPLQVKWSVPYLMSQVKVKNSVYNRSCNKTRGRNQILKL